MKAIIQGHETALQLQDGVWKPGTHSDAELTVLPDGRVLIHVAQQVFTARLLEINKADKTVILSLNGKSVLVTLKEPLDDLLHSMGLDKLTTDLATNAVMETTSRFMRGMPIEKKKNVNRSKSLPKHDSGMFSHINRKKLN